MFMPHALADLLDEKREALLTIWRKQVRLLPAARDLSVPRLNDHMPGLLDELVFSLRSQLNETIPEALANKSAFSHGLQRLDDQYDLEEVVSEYDIFRLCIHDLADSSGLNLQGAPFRILNRTISGAIGLAVKTFAGQQALEVRKQREEYLSFVVHDLRTPLNAISLITSVFEKEQKENAGTGAIRLLQILRRNVSNLSLLVQKILNENTGLITESVTRVEARLFELWPMVEGIVHDMVSSAGIGHCRILNEVSYDIVVYGDANLLRRVFQNLIANAAKYTPSGEVKIGAMSRGNEGAVECWVEDCGTGIPAERLQNIFQKLETDPESDGLGLGLAIVESFVKAHQGEVTVESKEGIGTTFHVLLPGPPSPAPQAAGIEPTLIKQ